MAAKKAQEQQAQANKHPDTPPPMLTAEQAQAQQLAAKQQYLEQKNAEMEKKATDFLAKPDLSAELKKSKIVAKTPDITPIVLTPEQAKAQQEALKAKSQPQQKTTMPPQEQKPEKPQVLVKQAPPTVPQPEKIEKDLINIIPNEYLKYVNHLFVWHGRNTCTARNPKCSNCTVKNFCDYKN